METIKKIEALEKINQGNAALINSLLTIVNNHVQQLSQEEMKLIRDLSRDHQSLVNEMKSLKV